MSTLDDRINRMLNPSEMTHSLPGLLRQLYFMERWDHTVVVWPASAAHGPSAPDVVVSGPLLTLSHKLGIDSSYQVFKIPTNVVGVPKFHVHWTKSDDLVRSGQTVKWVIEYAMVNGEDEVGNAVANTLVLPDTYEEGGTTTRIVYETANIDAPGIEAGHYVFLRLSAETPDSGTPVTAPGLVCVDMVSRVRINEDPTD